MYSKLPNWAKTSLGTPIELYFAKEQKLTDLRDPILLIGGLHGDEPEGVYLAKECLSWLQKQERRSVKDWVVIPVINPDGYQHNQRVNGNGIDLNRNFPSTDWSPKFEKERYQPGPRPASELEIQALTQLIENLKPQLIIHCHSWKPCIVNSGPIDLDAAQHLSTASGFKIVNSIGYETPGSFSSYGWDDLKIPVICIEDEEHRNPEIPWPRFGKGIAKIFFKSK